MRSACLILGFGVLAVLLQTTLFHLAPIIPDLVLVLCVYLGLFHHNLGGAVGAFLLGYILDTFSGAYPGLNAFAMTFVFLLVYLLSRRLWIEHGLSAIVLVFVAAVMKALTIVGLVLVFSGGLRAATIRDDILGGALAAVATPLVFGALDGGKRWLRVV
jgi:rod shape-determining protein MreD